MALFAPIRPRLGNRRQRVVIKTVIQQVRPARVPLFMTRLSVLCNGDRGKNHPLPCLMKFIGESLSDKGAPMSLYACPICGDREAYVQDYATGKPRLLFRKKGK